MNRLLLVAVFLLGLTTPLRSNDVHLEDGRVISGSLVLYSANGVTISSPRLAKPLLISWDKVAAHSLGPDEKVLQQAWLARVAKNPTRTTDSEPAGESLIVPLITPNPAKSEEKTDLTDLSAIREQVVTTWKANVGDPSGTDLETFFESFSDRPLLEKGIICLIPIGIFLLVFLPLAMVVEKMKKRRKSKPAAQKPKKKKSISSIKVATGFALFQGFSFFALSIVLPAEAISNLPISSSLLTVPLAILWTVLAVMNLYHFRTATLVMIALYLGLRGFDVAFYAGQIPQLLGVAAKTLVGLGFLIPGAISLFKHHRNLARKNEDAPAALEAAA